MVKNSPDESIGAEIGRRLREVRGMDSRERVRELTGLHPNTLANYEAGRVPDSAFVVRFCDAYGVNEAWLLSGRGEKLRAGGMGDSGREFRRDGSPAEDAAISVPLLDVRAGAGEGQLVWDEQPEAKIVFPRAMLNRMGVSPLDARLLTAKGDSMLPSIVDGSLILIDVGDIEPREDIFVLRYGDAILVKRLQRRLGGAIALRSDNPIYGEEELRADVAHDLQIIGRVRWVFRPV
jgi:phage repressor protein C with HTH and peptisase S24 domain